MDIKGKILEYWDWRSQTYSNGFKGFDAEERSVWRSELLEVLDGKEGLCVLDVGTGQGFLALILAEMGHTVTGVDLSKGMIEKAKYNARRTNLNVLFIRADAERLPFKDKSFDLIVSRHLLWTLPNPRDAVNEWIRVTKPNGSILAIDGFWFDPALRKRLVRGVSKAMRALAGGKLPTFYSVFTECYNPIRGHLPLYNDTNPRRICSLFEECGLSSITVNHLQNVKRFQSSRAPISYRITDINTTFLVKGERI